MEACALLGQETYPSPKVWTWQFQIPMLEASWLPCFWNTWWYINPQRPSPRTWFCCPSCLPDCSFNSLFSKCALTSVGVPCAQHVWLSLHRAIGRERFGLKIFHLLPLWGFKLKSDLYTYYFFLSRCNLTFIRSCIYISSYFIIYKLLNKNLNMKLELGEGSWIKFLSVFRQSSKGTQWRAQGKMVCDFRIQ